MTADIVIAIAFVAALLVLSAFFSGSETALTAASRARLHRLARGADISKQARRAVLVNRLTDHKERLIGGILLGNNLVNIAASAIATGLFITLFGDAGIVYATLAMTALVLIFAEVLPKTYAIANPDRFALAVAPAIKLVVGALSPVVRAVQAIVRATLKLTGIDIDARRDVLSAQEELRGAIELQVREGAMVKLERDMLSGILDLGEVEVSEVMVHRKNMVMIDLAEAPAAIVDRIVTCPHTRFPLWRGDPDNIVGIVHAKDVLRAARAGGGDFRGLDIEAIATEPWFVPETTTLREQLTAFRRRRAHFGLVVDEYGALMGLVTLEDILEEIVGDITDEHDITHVGARLQADGSIVVDGTVTIRDLNRQFGWALPDEVATTIAGLVIHEARTIPEPRQKFLFHGFGFEILRRQRNQITQLRLTPPGGGD